MMRTISLAILGLLISGSAMANMASGTSQQMQISNVCEHIKLNKLPISETEAATMNVGNQIRQVFNQVLKQHPQLAENPNASNEKKCQKYVHQSLHNLKKNTAL